MCFTPLFIDSLSFLSSRFAVRRLRGCRKSLGMVTNVTTRTQSWFKNVENSSKNNTKDICKTETLARKQATRGARLEYKDTGDREAIRADAFIITVGS
jgi:hypothetical protein